MTITAKEATILVATISAGWAIGTITLFTPGATWAKLIVTIPISYMVGEAIAKKLNEVL